MEKILNYSRSAIGEYDGVGQTRPWDCGPATAQVILQAAGINKSEDWLISAIGTTTSGTNHAGLIARVLDQLLPGSGYTGGTVWLPHDPPSAAQIEQLWANIKRSIDANRGVVLNFEAPPWNFPRGSNGSTSPEYRGSSTIYHYVAGMGYAIDASGGRHIWCADPGFRPFGYFARLEQVATLIVPHAYSFASTAPIPEPAKPTPAQPAPSSVARTDIEWRATQYGDPDAVAAVVASAQQDDRGKKALALLERVNPAALRNFIAEKG